ncbi:hypothetical protein ACFQ3N_15890 [Virgibacillus byunsanensis]|uniref:Serine/threonine protein kinase n=1 Tax=Virgibacillus byunsanensis TaxID=570945 RepID=A0ABW3LQE1_9BACI
MDTKYLKRCIKEIQVTNLDNADVGVVNDSPLEMIGKGRQGAVFKFTDDICVKVFGNYEDCDREHYALSLGQKTGLFPLIYAKGSLYIAMEFIRGVDIREYLQSQTLTEELSLKLIDMLITFKKIGYDRIDHHKRQIFLQPDGSLKVIDVARAVWRDRVYPYPRKLLTSLGEEYKELFLTHVQSLSPELYDEWKHYIHMEELSREIYQKLIPVTTDTAKLKTSSNKLLTNEDNKLYAFQLESLMHKVFKEEWVKTMLARGYNPDTVKEEIDEYWDKYELKYKEKDKGNQRSNNRKVINKRYKNSKNLKDSKKENDYKNNKGKKSSSGRPKPQGKNRRRNANPPKSKRRR